MYTPGFRHFKHWAIREWEISAGRLRLFMDQVKTIEGIKIMALISYRSEADQIVEALVRERAELESVEIDNSECTDDTLRLLIHNSKVKIVRLGGGNITGSYLMIPSLAGSSVIEVLNLSRCWNLSTSGIVGLLNKIGETLKILNLSGTLLTFSDVESLTYLPVLKEINLAGCRNLTEYGIMAFLNKAGKSLKILNLGCTLVSFSNVGSLRTSLPVLEELNLYGCRNLTDSATMAFLNKTGETLKILNLGDTLLSFSDVGPLTNRFTEMKALNLADCHNMTESAIRAFLSKTGANRAKVISGNNM